MQIMQAPLYDPVMVQPMRDELTEIGVAELRTSDQVEAAITAEGTTLVFVNSVCGCAAGGARPALRLALQNDVLPNRVVSVFAGMDREATEKARSYFHGYPPSSPQIALLRNGEIVHMMQRHHIEGNPPEAIAENLKQAFAEYCA
jgi:putative YphP/YqiW family bacilliredoxin